MEWLRLFGKTILKRRKIRVAVGPVSHWPSWRWIGPPTLKELSRDFDMSSFTQAINLPPAEVIVLLKNVPRGFDIQALRAQGRHVVYIPIDHYRSQEHIASDTSFLRACSSVLVHNRRLGAVLDELKVSHEFIEHHNRYGLARLAPFRSTGPLLWIGDLKYLAYAAAWSEKHKKSHEVLFVSNPSIAGPHAHAELQASCRAIGIDCRWHGDHRFNGIKVVEWSEKTQREALLSARAAFDIKGGPENFNQYMKPPTKAQKYICSGLPFACNREAYAMTYFAERGFSLASCDEFEKWLSHDYWLETRRHAKPLRQDLRLKHVVSPLRQAIQNAVATR